MMEGEGVVSNTVVGSVLQGRGVGMGGGEVRKVRMSVSVGASDSGLRVNKYILKREFRDVFGSKSATAAVLKAGLVALNGDLKGVEMTRVLREGDVVSILDGYESFLAPSGEIWRKGGSGKTVWDVLIRQHLSPKCHHPSKIRTRNAARRRCDDCLLETWRCSHRS